MRQPRNRSEEPAAVTPGPWGMLGSQPLAGAPGSFTALLAQKGTMRLRGLRELIEEAYGSGAADSNAGLLVLVRNPAAPIDSEDAWSEFVVVDIDIDSEGGDLDLLADSSESDSRMTLTDLSIELSELPAECDDLTVFVRGGHSAVSDSLGDCHRQSGRGLGVERRAAHLGRHRRVR